MALICEIFATCMHTHTFTQNLQYGGFCLSCIIFTILGVKKRGCILLHPFVTLMNSVLSCSDMLCMNSLCSLVIRIVPDSLYFGFESLSL
jgi:hypothetical protein